MQIGTIQRNWKLISILIRFLSRNRDSSKPNQFSWTWNGCCYHDDTLQYIMNQKAAKKRAKWKFTRKSSDKKKNEKLAKRKISKWFTMLRECFAVSQCVKHGANKVRRPIKENIIVKNKKAEKKTPWEWVKKKWVENFTYAQSTSMRPIIMVRDATHLIPIKSSWRDFPSFFFCKLCR